MARPREGERASDLRVRLRNRNRNRNRLRLRLRLRLRNYSETDSDSDSAEALARRSSDLSDASEPVSLACPVAKKPRQLWGLAGLQRGTLARFCRWGGACKRDRLRGSLCLRLRFWPLRGCGLWSRRCGGSIGTWRIRCGGRRARLRSMSRREIAVRVGTGWRGFRPRLGRRRRCARRRGSRWREDTSRPTRWRRARTCSIASRRCSTAWALGAEWGGAAGTRSGAAAPGLCRQARVMRRSESDSGSGSGSESEVGIGVGVGGRDRSRRSGSGSESDVGIGVGVGGRDRSRRRNRKSDSASESEVGIGVGLRCSTSQP